MKDAKGRVGLSSHDEALGELTRADAVHLLDEGRARASISSRKGRERLKRNGGSNGGLDQPSRRCCGLAVGEDGCLPVEQGEDAPAALVLAREGEEANEELVGRERLIAGPLAVAERNGAAKVALNVGTPDIAVRSKSTPEEVRRGG